jgi:hypothetical protein
VIVSSVLVEQYLERLKRMNENTVITHPEYHSSSPEREDFSEYVAHLQLHMALQARKLVPTLTQSMDSRESLLHQTQASFEKFVSRQVR